jgi:flagellar basal-body rod modification protein FlgD
MTTPVATTNTTPTPATTSSTSTNNINSGLSSLADNYQTFLTLLTTQLQNQDPLSPMDSSQFTSQLTQMTGVEQQLLSNQLLQQLVSANQGNGLQAGVSLIGKAVTAGSSTATLTSGSAAWPYTLSTAAANSTVKVLDNGGNVVWTGALTNMGVGSNTFTWNGQTTAGTQLDNGGTYTVDITATDAAGAPVNVSTAVSGTVTSAQQVNGVTMVTLSNSQVANDSVTVPVSSVTLVQATSSGSSTTQ